VEAHTVRVGFHREGRPDTVGSGEPDTVSVKVPRDSVKVHRVSVRVHRVSGKVHRGF
jgi:hypothetical protein